MWAACPARSTVTVGWEQEGRLCFMPEQMLETYTFVHLILAREWMSTFSEHIKMFVCIFLFYLYDC